MMLADAIFCVLGHLVGKRGQLLVPRELELHLLVREKLAQRTILEEIYK